jgi:hypothetical protein
MQRVPQILGDIRQGTGAGERAVASADDPKLHGVESGGDQDAAEQGVDSEHHVDESGGRAREPASGSRGDSGGERGYPAPEECNCNGSPARRSRQW